LVRSTNELLTDKHTSGFVTLFLAILGPEAGSLSCASAGHPNILLRRASREIDMPGQGSYPIGVFADAEWEPRETISGLTIFFCSMPMA
jgi:serine phosphatase RsbU (regulator of sigma subunit)